MRKMLRGLRICRLPNGRGLGRLHDTLNARLWPTTVEAKKAALESFWTTEFARFFGPLLPEIQRRSWLLCDPESPLLNLPWPYLYELDPPAAEVEELESLVLASGDGWRYVRGDYLLRVVNHLEEDNLAFYGAPAERFAELEDILGEDASLPELEKRAGELCEMAFLSYEGIWGAFFEDPKLLARTYFHCSVCFSVLEINEGVGPEGDWLSDCRRSSPYFPALLAP